MRIFLLLEMLSEQDVTLGSQNNVENKNCLDCVVMDKPALWRNKTAILLPYVEPKGVKVQAMLFIVTCWLLFLGCCPNFKRQYWKQGCAFSFLFLLSAFRHGMTCSDHMGLVSLCMKLSFAIQCYCVFVGVKMKFLRGHVSFCVLCWDFFWLRYFLGIYHCCHDYKRERRRSRLQEMFLNSTELVFFLLSGRICCLGNTPIVINLILHIVIDGNSRLNCI